MNNKLTDIKYVKGLALRYGFRFSKSLGQNFLVRESVLDRTLDVCGADENTAVLEIGPGIGTLTMALASRAGKVVSAEIDKSLIPILEETTAEAENVHILCADALKLDLAKLCEEELSFEKRIVCANLPYYITAQAVEKVLTSRLFGSVTLMLQYEAAKRICSRPGDEQYCALAALADFYCLRSIPFLVPADCFYPQPGVGSAVLHLEVREELPYDDDRYVCRLINAAFAQRRKTMANSLANSGFCTRADAERALAEAGFEANCRAEMLSGEDFARLAACLRNLNA